MEGLRSRESREDVGPSPFSPREVLVEDRLDVLPPRPRHYRNRFHCPWLANRGQGGDNLMEKVNSNEQEGT